MKQYDSAPPITIDTDKEYTATIVLEKGEDILFISSGAILSECLKASNELRKKNINCSVVNMHTIKPIDENIINKYPIFFPFLINLG